jgi:hypothetical protein
MRPFLLAGSSLLALVALVGAASATDVKFINSSPAVNGQIVASGFVQGDVLINPDGLFDAQLQGDGNFVIHYGSTPDQPVDWASGEGGGNAGAPYGLGVYRNNGFTSRFPNSITSFDIYQNNTPANYTYALEGSNFYDGPSFFKSQQ